MRFKAGDKVRLLHSTDAGVIIKIVDDKTAEVAIQDGFVIPVLLSELVSVAEEEKVEFDAEPPKEEELPILRQYKEPVFDDILLALEETVSGDIRMSMVNDTDFTLLYAISGMSNAIYHELYKGITGTRTFQSLDTGPRIKPGKYQKLHIQIILSAPQCKDIPYPIVFEKRWDFHELLKKKEFVTLLDRKASILRLNPDKLNINPGLLKERMLEGRPGSRDLSTVTAKGPEEMVVDLHIEKLMNDPASLTPGEILDIQINAFEKALDDAVVSGVKRIKFIHGLGKGTLRQTIHKKLSNSSLIRYFKDVEKSRFGYGATMIYLK